MPVTPSATELPAVEQEVRRLTSLLPDATLLKGHHATRDAVLAALPSHSLAHFSCHGTSDWDDPSRSHLLLHDHATKPLTVTAISGLHLTGADLACLSACRTADTSPSLADEAIHITAAFQLAGYRNVIGTLWSVYDQSATSITDDVYTELTGGGTHPPDTRRTAQALHNAVRRLRADHLDDPMWWVAHIHTGT